MPGTFKVGLPLRSDRDPDPAVAQPLRRVREQTGMVPNMYAEMSNFPPLLDAYQHGSKLFRSQAGFTAVEQELILLAISRENECHYCVAAHSFLAQNAGVPSEIIEAIRSDRPIPDSKLEALRTFVRKMVESRGNPTDADAKAFLDSGYSEKQILGIILAIGVKVLSNYTNHIFHTEVDDAFTSVRWEETANADASA